MHIIGRLGAIALLGALGLTAGCASEVATEEEAAMPIVSALYFARLDHQELLTYEGVRPIGVYAGSLVLEVVRPDPFIRINARFDLARGADRGLRICAGHNYLLSPSAADGTIHVTLEGEERGNTLAELEMEGRSTNGCMDQGDLFTQRTEVADGLEDATPIMKFGGANAGDRVSINMIGETEADLHRGHEDGEREGGPRFVPVATESQPCCNGTNCAAGVAPQEAGEFAGPI